MFCTPPDYHLLKVFECLCFSYLCPYNRHEMNFRSQPCVFLGYSHSHHGYRCLDTSTGKLYIALHVHFDETQFPFATKSILCLPDPNNLHPWVSAPLTLLYLPTFQRRGATPHMSSVKFPALIRSYSSPRTSPVLNYSCLFFIFS